MGGLSQETIPCKAPSIPRHLIFTALAPNKRPQISCLTIFSDYDCAQTPDTANSLLYSPTESQKWLRIQLSTPSGLHHVFVELKGSTAVRFDSNCCCAQAAKQQVRPPIPLLFSGVLEPCKMHRCTKQLYKQHPLQIQDIISQFNLTVSNVRFEGLREIWSFEQR